ncbi:MAG: hypothetical protein PHU46_05300 [Rhodocyclaceae bacterium]|nr:hypothetical protein [Rhodocyclaceae bacterium]
MAVAMKLSDDLVNAARPYATAMQRSVPKQIEYWARIGKSAEENPDLPLGFIIDTLVGIEEDRAGLGSEYKFG